MTAGLLKVGGVHEATIWPVDTVRPRPVAAGGVAAAGGVRGVAAMTAVQALEVFGLACVLTARTRTWYSEASVSPVMTPPAPRPVWVRSTQAPPVGRYWTWYPPSELPSVAGAVHETLNCRLPGVRVRPVGTPGAVDRRGVALPDDDQGPAPRELTARTPASYAVPFVNERRVSPLMRPVWVSVVHEVAPVARYRTR